jgi:hypothetical protein
LTDPPTHICIKHNGDEEPEDPTYTADIDFKKAFDSVDREIMRYYVKEFQFI